jgi:hypothetical protein
MGAHASDFAKGGDLQPPQAAALRRYLQASWLSPAFLASQPPASAQPAIPALAAANDSAMATQVPQLRTQVGDNSRTNQRILAASRQQMGDFDQLLSWYCENATMAEGTNGADSRPYACNTKCCSFDHTTTMTGNLSGADKPLVIKKLYTTQTGSTCNIPYTAPPKVKCTPKNACELSCTDGTATDTLDLTRCYMPYTFTPIPCTALDNDSPTNCTVEHVVPLTQTTPTALQLRWQDGMLQCPSRPTLPPCQTNS